MLEQTQLKLMKNVWSHYAVHIKPRPETLDESDLGMLLSSSCLS